MSGGWRGPVGPMSGRRTYSGGGGGQPLALERLPVEVRAGEDVFRVGLTGYRVDRGTFSYWLFPDSGVVTASPEGEDEDVVEAPAEPSDPTERLLAKMAGLEAKLATASLGLGGPGGVAFAAEGVVLVVDAVTFSAVAVQGCNNIGQVSGFHVYACDGSSWRFVVGVNGGELREQPRASAAEADIGAVLAALG